jgi:4-amino-4-deoxy-L-arabinose transferase-like glycosyltransferase
MINTKSNSYNLYFAIPFLIVAIPYVTGLFLNLMDVDAAQYAAMSMQMESSGSYLKVYYGEENYLDKPPLVFWLAVLSFKIFGVSDFAYRLPSFLSTILGIYATYKLARLFYNERTAYVSALMIASCQAYFLFNHDVRTDTLLTNFVITAIWQISLYLKSPKLTNLILGFVCVGMAMLAKGIVGLMVPGLAFAIHFIITKDWKQFLRWEWLLGTAIIALVLLPMCIGLYEQHGTYGLRFYFWIQSFGRITGENVWKNDADAFFFVHTFLWSFLPWSLIFGVGLFVRLRNLFTKYNHPTKPEYITLAGFVLPYIILSASKYQLNHYIYVLFPLAAIIAADYTEKNILSSEARYGKAWLYVQAFVIFVLWLLGITLAAFSFPLANILIWGIALVFLAGSLFLLLQKTQDSYKKIILPSFIAITGVNFLLNTHIYPSLFRYESELVAARYVLSLPKAEQDRFHWYKEHEPSIDFYSFRVLPYLTREKLTLEKTQYLVYTTEEGKKEIEGWGYPVEVTKTFEHFHISTLTPAFLNPATRSSELQTRYLLKVYGTKYQSLK